MKRHDSSGTTRRAGEAKHPGAPKGDPSDEDNGTDMEILKVLIGADVEVEGEASRQHVLRQMNDSIRNHHLKQPPPE